MYGLIGTARMNGIDPKTYLREVYTYYYLNNGLDFAANDFAAISGLVTPEHRSGGNQRLFGITHDMASCWCCLQTDPPAVKCSLEI